MYNYPIVNRIALVGPVYPYRGGIAHYTSHLAAHLIENGWEVKIYSFARQYPASLYPGSSDKDPSQDAIRSDADFILDPLYPWTWDKCGRRIIEWKPDLVIIPWWTTFWGFAFARLIILLNKAGIRTVLLIHNVLPHESKPWDRLITKLVFHQTNLFITQSNTQRDALLQILSLMLKFGRLLTLFMINSQAKDTAKKWHARNLTSRQLQRSSYLWGLSVNIRGCINCLNPCLY